MRVHHHHHGHGGWHGRFAMRGGDGSGWFASRGRGGEGGGRDDGWDGRGRRGRVLDGGALRLVLLALLADQPRHGYDLIRAIEERTGGAYAPSPGMIYPTLTLLAEMGHAAEVPTDGARKQFAATDAGRALLAERADEVATLLARLDALGAVRARSEGAAIRRAMGNLKAVLHHRLGGDEEAAIETIHAAVALIDEAAQRIERL